MRAHFLIRRKLILVSILLLLGWLAPASSFGQDLFYSVLFDTDNSPLTGCDVGLLGPDVEGIERRLTASVSRVTYQVTQTTLESCNTGTGFFEAPVVVGGGYPVALSQGVDGSDAVEIEVALSQIGTSAGRIIFLAERPGFEDLLETAGPAIAVPVLTWRAMALLATILLAIGIVVLHRWGLGYLSGLILVSITGISIAAGFMADGDLSDWLNTPPVALDPTGDSSSGVSDVDIVAGFFASEAGNLFFRTDILDIEPPTAVDDNYVIPALNPVFEGNNIVSTGTGMTVTDPLLGVLGNDTDPEGDTLTVTVFDATGTNGGSVSVNPDGTFSYTSPPPGPATDTFTYQVADPGGLEDSGTVTINLAGTILTDGGAAITVTHIDANAGGTNTGTFENPFNALPATQGTHIVFIHADSNYNLQNYALNSNQRLLGEGDGNQHLFQTDQLGQINLPAGNGGVNRPVIPNTPGVALDTAVGSEISNFNITGAGTAARLNNLAGEVNLNRTLITGGNTGIDIIGGGGTFTFTDVTITDPTGDGVHVNGGSSTVKFGELNNPAGGLFGPSTLNQNSGGTGIRVEGGHTGVLNQDSASPIFANNGDGLQFDNANGTYDFAGTVTLNGGDAGIDILGGSAGTFTFSNTDITSPTGSGLNVDGGSADVTFGAGSSITQVNNASAVKVQGAHTGILDFGGSVNATNGDGLQFDNADGTYDFGGSVTLAGGNAGIDILGGSAGTFTFTNTDITSPTGSGLNVDGGSADVTFGAGSSIAQTNNAASVNVQGGHTGMLDFGGSVNATNGTGLQFDNADGTYDFTPGPVTLNGGDAGIDILGGSAGTFTFTDTTITSPTGQAFRAQDVGSPGTVNFNGSIMSTGGFELVEIDTTAAGSIINFNNTGANSISGNGAGGIQIFDADGNITFTMPVTIVNPSNGFLQTGISIFGGSGNIDFGNTSVNLPADGFNAGVEINSHSGALSFNNLDITVSGSGTPGNGMAGLTVFNANTLNISGNNSIDITGGPGIELNGANNINMTFDSVTVNNSQDGFAGGSGITLTNVGGGTFDVTGTMTGNGANGAAGIGIDIDNASGTFTFADVDIDTTTLDGIAVGTLSGNPGTVNINGGSVSNTGSKGARVNNAGGFNLNNTTFTGTTGVTVDLTGSTVSGGGNVAAPFSCTDGGGNAGQILFNGGVDTCP